MSNHSETEVIKLNYKLIKLMKSPSIGRKRVPGIVLLLLSKLRWQPMTLDLLMKTKVGVTVNEVLKLNLAKDVTAFAAKIISEWSQLLPKRIGTIKPKELIGQPLKSVDNLSTNNSNTNTINKMSNEKMVKLSADVTDNKENKENKRLTLKPKLKKSVKLMTSTPKSDAVISGHELYESIINKKKERNGKQLSGKGVGAPSPWAMTTKTKTDAKVRHKRFQKCEYERIENWIIPNNTPIITPIDRLKILRLRTIESQSQQQSPSTSSQTTTEYAYKDPQEVELKHNSRVRSSKVMGRNIKRVEHRPKWMANITDNNN